MNYLSRLFSTGSLALILGCAASPKEAVEPMTTFKPIPARDPTCPYEIFGLERQGRYFTFACTSTNTPDICDIEGREYESMLRVHRKRCR